LKPPLDRSCGGRKGVAGERGAEMVVWFGGCRDFGRKSPRSTPYFDETRRLRGDFHCMRP
jgi:hypothetical protein